MRSVRKLENKQMANPPKSVDRNYKAAKTKGLGKANKPARHIEETARLASSVEINKNPAKVRRTKD
jgi:hypothetical protein